MYLLGYVWLMSMIIGVIIGGITNYIAIVMLFRPYEKKIVWGIHLPLTPGIIPKRQKEIAYQLGQVVEKHLVTKEAIIDYLQSSNIHHEMRDWLERMILQQVENIKQKKIGDLTQHVGFRLEDLAVKGTNELLEKVQFFVRSYNGERLLHHWVELAIEKQGPFSRMMDFLLPKDKITSKLQEWISEWIEQQSLRQWIYHQILQELQNFAVKEVLEMLPGNFDQVLKVDLPALLDRIIQRLHQEVKQLIDKFQLAGIVEKQILSYPLSQLEDLIREIAKKELMMITIFGALLGGILGGVQAIILTFFLI